MSTSPSAGQAVAPPAAVTLNFDDVVQLPPGAIRMTGPRGTAVSVRAAQPDSRTLQGLLPGKLGGGRYTVRWRIVADDGHIVSGTFAFSVRPGAGRASAGVSMPARGSPPSRGGGTLAVVLTLLLSLVTIAAIGVAFVRLRRERARR